MRNMPSIPPLLFAIRDLEPVRRPTGRYEILQGPEHVQFRHRESKLAETVVHRQPGKKLRTAGTESEGGWLARLEP